MPDAGRAPRPALLTEGERTMMRRIRRRTAGGALALMGLTVALSACEVRAELDAECSAYPDPWPLPGGGPGVVTVDLEVPAAVAPGATFTVRVDDLHGYSVNDWGAPEYPEGTLAVTGPVEPSGQFHVGEGALVGGEPLPNTLTFTATGEAGDSISIDVVEASSLIGGFLQGHLTTCTPTGDTRVASVPIEQPG